MPTDKGASCCCIPRYISSCIPTHLHNLPTALTEPAAEQHTEHFCTTLLKTESCQLSRNFQNLHSNAVLVCEYINIWSFKEVIRVLVEEIFYERLCSCVKIAFLDVLVCHSDHKFYERLCSCVKIASAE